MIKAGIYSGASLRLRNTIGELTRLLLVHPDVELMWIQSAAAAGQTASSLFAGLIGDTDIRLSAQTDPADCVFLCCTPEEAVAAMNSDMFAPDSRIIDLTGAFRDSSDNEHGFVYGLPELNRKTMVRGASRVANPGDVATAIELALLPMAKNLMLNSPIFATAIVSDGRPMAVTYPSGHPQLPEITRTLSQIQTSYNSRLNLLTVGGQHSRVTMAIVCIDTRMEADTLQALYEEFYSDHSFTYVVGRAPSVADVLGTNKCMLHIDKADGRIVITSLIDRALKGDAGQAIHNMNLLFGLQERTGLHLNAAIF